jgi:hypothetical protein
MAAFYLLSSVGYGVEVHYCLGRVSDVNYVLLDTSCACDEAGIPAHKRCCEERSFFHQIDDEHQLSSTTCVQSPYDYLIAWTPVESNLLTPSEQADGNVLEEGESPPIRPRFLLYHQWVTYG